MTMLFIGSMLFFLILYMASKGKYGEYIEPLHKKDFRLKELLPMGFWIMEKSKYRYKSLYDRTLRLKIGALYGAKYVEYYLWVHWANKITSLVLGLVLACMIGAGWGNLDLTFPLMVVVLLGVLFFALDQELTQKIEKRKLSIQRDFPDFLNKLTLLLNAGMTVFAAWERIVKENQKNTPFYIQAEVVVEEIKNGKTQAQAFEDFARNCRVSEITKFVSILIQNLRKGNGEMVITLQGMSREAWELRKHVAKRLGEEASTKLLFPMMFNFLVVVVIVAMPAVMAMRI
jgi:tight adherence protein C